ncbi:MAG: hypothetical protein WC821_05590 [archaeon]|jgi:hypothetical protein
MNKTILFLVICFTATILLLGCTSSSGSGSSNDSNKVTPELIASSSNELKSIIELCEKKSTLGAKEDCYDSRLGDLNYLDCKDFPNEKILPMCKYYEGRLKRDTSICDEAGEYKANCYYSVAVLTKNKELCNSAKASSKDACLNEIDKLLLDDEILKGSFDFSCSPYGVNYVLQDKEAGDLVNGRKIGNWDYHLVGGIFYLTKEINGKQYYATSQGVFSDFISQGFDELGNFYYLKITNENKLALYKNKSILTEYKGDFNSEAYLADVYPHYSGYSDFFGFKLLTGGHYLFYGLSSDKKEQYVLYFDDKKIEYALPTFGYGQYSGIKYSAFETAGTNFAFIDDRKHLIFNGKDLGGEIKHWAMNDKHIFYTLYNSSTKLRTLYLDEKLLDDSSDQAYPDFDLLTLDVDNYANREGYWESYLFVNGKKQENTLVGRHGGLDGGSSLQFLNGNYIYTFGMPVGSSVFYNNTYLGNPDNEIVSPTLYSDGTYSYFNANNEFIYKGKNIGKASVYGKENDLSYKILDWYDGKSYYYFVKRIDENNNKKYVYDYYFNDQLVQKNIKDYSLSGLTSSWLIGLTYPYDPFEMISSSKGLKIVVTSDGTNEKVYLNDKVINDGTTKTANLYGLSSVSMNVCN